MQRRKTKTIRCGNVLIGSSAPVCIQSMTTTDTKDAAATAAQIKALRQEGCQIVRVAVPDRKAAAAIFEIKNRIGDIPLVCDIHFDARLAVLAIEAGADKIRINPGNIGGKDKLRLVVDAARKKGIPIRVGVNSGSLEKDILSQYGGVTAQGLAESALRNVRMLEEMDFEDIVISVKSSDLQMNYDAHRILAQKTEYPFHIGITESGTINGGVVKSAAGLGALLLSGMGDTIRVSLTGNPIREVKLAKDLLKACGIRKEGVNIISCPTCGRCSVDLEPIALSVEEKTKDYKRHLTVAVMGCEVNGPGEAREADFGLAFGKGRAAVFQKGKVLQTVDSKEAVDTLMRLLRETEREESIR